MCPHRRAFRARGAFTRAAIHFREHGRIHFFERNITDSLLGHDASLPEHPAAAGNLQTLRYTKHAILDTALIVELPIPSGLALRRRDRPEVERALAVTALHRQRLLGRPIAHAVHV